MAEDELTEHTSAVTLLGEIKARFLFNSKDERNPLPR